MKERPIIFDGESVRGILEGRKTQTRLVVVPQPDNPECFGPSPVWGSGIPCFEQGGKPIPKENRRFCVHAAFDEGGKRVDRWLPCPYGIPGDRLYVKEKWAENYIRVPTAPIHYRADLPDDPDDAMTANHAFGLMRWQSAQKMSRHASRLTLEISEVRVERLRSISEEDARSEGCEHLYVPGGRLQPGGEPVPNDSEYSTVERFRYAWDSINGKDHPWASNPFVWVISFRRL